MFSAACWGLLPLIFSTALLEKSSKMLFFSLRTLSLSRHHKHSESMSVWIMRGGALWMHSERERERHSGFWAQLSLLDSVWSQFWTWFFRNGCLMYELIPAESKMSILSLPLISLIVQTSWEILLLLFRIFVNSHQTHWQLPWGCDWAKC